MCKCLIAADNSFETVSDCLLSLFRFCRNSGCTDGQVQEVLAQVESLLKANTGFKNINDDTIIFHWACTYLEGEVDVVIVSLLLNEYSDGIGAGLKLPDEDGCLPIHFAVEYSTVDVVMLLLKAYPESRYEIDRWSQNSI